MATRFEVARHAGVSLRTVTNVLNDFAHVAPATRQRVLDAIEELGYRPNELARSLKRGRSGLVGLMLPELDTPYFADLTRCFVEAATARGISIVLDQTDGDPDRERAFLHRVGRGRLFDGVVINPLSMTPEQAADEATAHGPAVFLGEDDHPGWDKVMVDSVAASRDAVRFLLASGRRRIAAIGVEPDPHGPSAERLRGWRAAHEESGIVPEAGLVRSIDEFSAADGARVMRELLDDDVPFDAVFCCSDVLALGALHALAERGLRVPDDVAVMGFDDVPDAGFTTPSLTTVAADRRWIADTALDRLLARIDDPALPAETFLGPYRLVARDSAPGVPTAG